MWFDEIDLSHLNQVGGKNSSLGEMIQYLTKNDINVPFGFAITTTCFDSFMKYNKLDKLVKQTIDSIDFTSLEDLRRKALKIRTEIYNGTMSEDMQNEIKEYYSSLSTKYTDNEGNPQTYTDVAVRSSSTAEDLPDASFAGQQDTYLNVRGDAQLISSVKSCFSSLYTDRAIVYRHTIKYEDKISISVGIQKMVRSDIGSSGVAFSIDTESGFKDAILINASYGLGELVVQGSVKPDEYILFKPTLNKGYDAIIDKKLGTKTDKMVYGTNAEQKTKIVHVHSDLQNKFCLTDKEIVKLGKWVCIIEKYYSERAGKHTPMDVEWALDGDDGKLYIVQARPETVVSKKSTTKIKEYKIKPHTTKPICTGTAVGDLVSSGSVKIITSLDKRYAANDPNNFKPGDILVTDMTDPDWEPVMKISGGIITNKGGRTCHSAIVARELGIPAIVGTDNATQILKDDQVITMSCSEGEIGYIYPGNLPFTIVETDFSKIKVPETTLMLNIGSPENVFRTSFLPHKGVGLAREEFIISNFIGIHPLAILNYDKLEDEIKEQIDEKIVGYSPISYYIEKLAHGIARIGAAFYPHDVIVRFSDFKSNEYRNLLGGDKYEPHEENPMIGFRGASRYYSKSFKEAFGMECKAIKIVREKYGLENVIVMVPFCRTPNEMRKVLGVMEEYGLVRGKNNLKVYIMCEIPSNVILAKQFSELVDGFSIGSNDLTQLTLGLDRDSHLVSHIYDERSEAVKMMISNVIKTAKENNCKIGICGQGPSDFPDFAQFLVEEGIDSISVTHDSFVKTMNAINDIEKEKEKEKEKSI
jgi:pyruvate, water dikinase